MNVTNETKGLLINYSLKKASSNLLVDKIKSIVAFKRSDW